MPRSPRLLVVYKKSQLELYQQHDPAAGEHLRDKEPEIWARFQSAHSENARAIEKVRAATAKQRIEADFVWRADHNTADGYDLVVSVGGDGTLLDVSHCVFRRPLLGVSSSVLSVGHFCATDAAGFGDALARWQSGELTAVQLNRLQITVNGEAFGIPVLNEILYTAPVPAAVSRYVLTVDGRQEEHKSSGIWIATAAGSTAAIQSAGGVVMETSDDRIQYIVREPYRGGGDEYELVGGFLDGSMELLAKMRTAALYVDGHREQIWLSLGDRVVIDRHPHPLNLLGYGATHAQTA